MTQMSLLSAFFISIRVLDSFFNSSSACFSLVDMLLSFSTAVGSIRLRADMIVFRSLFFVLTYFLLDCLTTLLSFQSLSKYFSCKVILRVKSRVLPWKSKKFPGVVTQNFVPLAISLICCWVNFSFEKLITFVRVGLLVSVLTGVCFPVG